MGLHFWLYVSRSTIPQAETDQVIEEMVKAAQKRNSALRITGALVYSDLHFGQIVEGPAESIMLLRSSILSDVRHASIRTISDGRCASRQFGKWALAYSGRSIYVSRALQGALRDAALGAEGAGAKLLELMQETAISP